MEVLLLGTGAGDGWPNPFCGCASCSAQRTAGVLRGPSSALVDGVLWIDPGPEAPRAAERLAGPGAPPPLGDVRTVLITHGHPDHLAPAFLLWRGWLRPHTPLQVVGPAEALALCRPWVGPDDGTAWVPVQAGDVVVLPSGHTVQALAADHDDPVIGPGLLYLVTGPDGARLLYATDTGPLPAPTLAALAGTRLDAVLLEETFGDLEDPAGQSARHLDLPGFAATLAALRAAGCLDDATVVRAVHLAHHNPPEPELVRRLATWHARPGQDGELLHLRDERTTPRPRRAPRRVLVLGGARSGKSVEAERRLAAEPRVRYVATGPGPEKSADPEWAARVAAHRARRPASWHTVETARTGDLAEQIVDADCPVLVDCLTLWLADQLDRLAAWPAGPDSSAELPDGIAARLEVEFDRLVRAWQQAAVDLVAVSNEVGSGVVPATASGRLLRDLLGRLNARLAAESDEVLLTVAGRVLPLPPIPPQPGGQP